MIIIRAVICYNIICQILVKGILYLIHSLILSPLRSVAVRSYPSPKVGGGDHERQAATAQERPRGASPCSRPGAAAKRINPTSEE